jgi:putative NIF3 family GTP cyclohydrolase 1 type 2
MKTQDIYQKGIEMGIDADFRTKEQVQKVLERNKKKFEKLSDKQKEGFDQESFSNPYSDTRVLHVAEDKDIKKVLVGIDIEPAEILLAKELGDIDLVISHHPIGRALADLHEVMELQVDILNQYGVPVNIAEGLLNPRNNWRTVDTAKLLGVNLICIHTAADNNAARFLREKIEEKDPEHLEDIMEILGSIEEYQIAKQMGAGPKLFVGSPENRCGKIALTELTGGTEGSPKLMEKIAQAGIGTIVGMHTSEDHKKEAETANLNVVIAGHMSSDSIGMNIILDELEKQGIEIVPCSGFLRVSRAQ